MKIIIFIFGLVLLFNTFVSAQIYTSINYSGFESGEQGWTDGGADSIRSSTRSNVTDTGLQGGTWSWNLQDNGGTSFTEQAFDFTGYNMVNISWSSYYTSIEGSEDLELSCDGNTLWTYQANTLGTEDRWLGEGDQQYITLYPTNCTFDSSVTITFTADFSANDDDVFIDGINITGFVNSVPDTINPNVTGLIPLSGTNYTTTQDIQIAANVTDNVNVSSVFANVTLPNGTINGLTLSLVSGGKYNSTFSIPELLGRYNITIIANDTSNNVNSTSITYFNLIDLTPPSINIISPQNISYFNNNSLLINLSVIDYSNIWFFNGTANESYSVPVYRNYGFGSNTLIAYANDSSGNINFSSVDFVINNLSLSCEVGGPYQQNALVLIEGNLLLNGNGLENQVNTTISSNGFVVRSYLLNTSEGSYHHQISDLAVGNYILNVSASYEGYNISCSDSFNIGSSGAIFIDKIASIQLINSTDITYNITLRLINSGGSSILNGNITDESVINFGNLSAGIEFKFSYLKYFARENDTYYSALPVAIGRGIDSFSESLLTANSTEINVSVPALEETANILILKNIQYISQTGNNITFNVSSMIYNAGNDLENIVYTDTDINPTSFVFNLSKDSSLLLSNNVLVSKAATNTIHTFAQGTAVIDLLSFYSNIPSISIPGYGGPADTIVYAPATVASSTSFNSIIEIINQNPDIGQNFLADYWITNEAETVNYSAGQQTIYVAASGSTNLTATLTSPSAVGTYRLRALVSYEGGPDLAFDTFEVVSSGSTGSGSSGGGSGGGGGSSGDGGSGGSSPSISGNIIVTPPGVVCDAPYIRHGQDCCLDNNGNSICDDDEEPVEVQVTEEKSALTGLALLTDPILRRVTFSAILLLVSIILLIVTYWYYSKGPFKNTIGLLSYVNGKEVYTDRGMKIGKVYEIMILDNRIYGLMVVVDSGAPINLLKVMIRYEFVQSIHDVVVVNSRISQESKSPQSG